VNQMFVFIAINVLLVFISIPPIRRELPMNSAYGFRFPAAMKSEEAWYRINAFGGKVFAASSCLSILGLIGLRLIQVVEPLLYISMFAIPLVFSTILIMIYSNRQA